MLAYDMKNLPEIHQRNTIQTEGHNRRASCWRQADDPGSVGVPCEVVDPALLPGVIERYSLQVDRIDPFSLRVLVPVAALARPGQILE